MARRGLNLRAPIRRNLCSASPALFGIIGVSSGTPPDLHYVLLGHSENVTAFVLREIEAV